MTLSFQKVQDILLAAFRLHTDPEDALRETQYQLALRAVQALTALPRDAVYWRAVDQSFRLLAYTGHFRGYLRLPLSQRNAIGLGPTATERWFSLMDIWIELMEFVHDHHERMIGGWPHASDRKAIAEDLQTLQEAKTELAGQYVVKGFLMLPSAVLQLACQFSDRIIRCLLGEEQADQFNEQYDPLLPQVRLFQRQLTSSEDRIH